MKIYIVLAYYEGADAVIHSAHYSKWVAELTRDCQNKEPLGDHSEWYVLETELTRESD